MTKVANFFFTHYIICFFALVTVNFYWTLCFIMKSIWIYVEAILNKELRKCVSGEVTTNPLN